MSSLAQTLVTWAEFLRLPERPENGMRYELHDGEVVIVPAPRPRHVKVQKRIERLLAGLAGERAVVPTEFPYRPAPNLQYWVADVACVRRAADADQRTVQVTDLSGTRFYAEGDTITPGVLGGGAIAVADIFDV